MTLISVIVPVYNVEPYLRRCIDSILSQTFTDFELILVDDGSTDNCPFICDDYAQKDSRIHVIHQDNGGVSNARNAGIRNATGKYITFCDSDDYYLPDWLHSFFASSVQKDADCIVFLSHCPGSFFMCFSNDKDRADYILKVLLKKDGWEVWNRLYKTSILSKYGILFCENCEDFAEDLAFNLEYSLYCDSVIVMQNNGYKHTNRSGSIINLSKSQIRFNALNEVSRSLFKRLEARENNNPIKRIFPLIHYEIIDNQYERLIRCGRIRNLKEEINKVQKQEWMKNKIIRYLIISSRCKEYFSNTVDWKRSVLKSHYLLHQNYDLLRLERKLKGIQL